VIVVERSERLPLPVAARAGARAAIRIRTELPVASPPCSPVTTNAAPTSRASLVSRTASTRAIGGAPSITTSAKAPERSRRSAHHAALAGLVGRMIQSGARSLPTCAQSRGASVRVASM
jgi:hypothetical protein